MIQTKPTDLGKIAGQMKPGDYITIEAIESGSLGIMSYEVTYGDRDHQYQRGTLARSELMDFQGDAGALIEQTIARLQTVVGGGRTR